MRNVKVCRNASQVVFVIKTEWSSAMTKRRRYRILSLDGGGIRGVFTARVLERLNEKEPDFLNSIDLIAGTSTGSILAVGIADGKPPREMVAFYRQQAPLVFKDNLYDNIRDIGHFRGAQYSIKNFKKALRKHIGNIKLKDLGKRVLIPTFDLDAPATKTSPRTWKPKFFHNFPGPYSDREELALDVILRSCAAPIYFPTYQGYIDGGVVANNPAMAALAQALRSEKLQIGDIRLLSLGTGHNPTHIEGQRLDWGLVQWAPLLNRLMAGGAMGVADYQCRQILGRDYRRLSAVFDKPVPLDGIDKIDYLIEQANNLDLTSTIRWIRKGSSPAT